MPFNFLNYETYSINYPNLKDYLLNLDVFSDKKTQEKYINTWLKIIKDHDKTLTDQLNTPKKIQDYSNSAMEYGELESFQQPITFGNEELFIHFRISPLLKLVDQEISHEKNTIEIEIADLTKESTPYKWQPANTKPNQTFNDKPILMVPYKNGQYNFLVIDGNHRITTAVENAKPKIKSLTLTESSVIDMKIHSSSFDSLLYIFLNEITQLANKKHFDNFSDKKLLELTYLTDGKYKLGM